MVLLRILRAGSVGTDALANFFSYGLTAFRGEDLAAVGGAGSSAGKSEFFLPALFINGYAVNDSCLRTFDTFLFCDIAVGIV